MNVKHKINRRLLDKVADIATMAGQEILNLHDNLDLSVDYKQDGSPLTLADLRSHEVIQSSLQELTPDIPILSEESLEEIHNQRLNWSTLWMVDPLDGTKYFLAGKKGFTVNIALIQDSRPVLGVVYAPAYNLLHFGAHGIGAFCATPGYRPRPIQTRDLRKRGLVMVASRSHWNANLHRFRCSVLPRFPKVKTVYIGSSLKICLVAEGVADVYPRFGPTSEWDTAAAHCVLEVAGGKMQDVDGNPLEYNKLDILNPWFFASGSSEVNWGEFNTI